MLIFLVTLGIASVYDFLVGDGDIPNPTYVGYNTPEKELVYKNTSPHISYYSSNEEWFESLDKTFVLLRKVAPHVEKWVKDQESKDLIVFERTHNNTFARYDYVTGKLIMNISLMSQVDGHKAAILAHEWRHSRQNWSKWYKSVIACMILGEEQEDILETDAYLYEAKTLLAFYP